MRKFKFYFRGSVSGADIPRRVAWNVGELIVRDPCGVANCNVAHRIFHTLTALMLFLVAIYESTSCG